MSKVIIGAADTHYEGWISTNIGELNLLRVTDWRKYEPVEMALAEHVWEHLTPEQGIIAAHNVYQYVPRIRVATPDGYFPDEDYITHAKLGECKGDHNALYTINTLWTLFEMAGYEVTPLEWWDRDGAFTYRPWSSEQGHVMRSLRYDKRNGGGKIDYTSIIVDCVRGHG